MCTRASEIQREGKWVIPGTLRETMQVQFLLRDRKATVYWKERKNYKITILETEHKKEKGLKQ